jgi:hypothetical protein
MNEEIQYDSEKNMTYSMRKTMFYLGFPVARFLPNPG